MSITMTKTGRLPEEKGYTGRCSKCGSEYKAMRKDLDYESDFRESTYSARCQLHGCGSLIYFKQDR